MNHCWRLGQCTARQVWEKTLDERERDYQTVKTLLDRMVVKGYLEMEKLGPLCLFTPKVSRKEATSVAIRDFIDIVLDHSLDPLVAHLTDQRELSEDDLAALRSVLDASKGAIDTESE